MGWQCVMEIKSGLGLNVPVKIGNMLTSLPGENMMIVGKALHKFNKEDGLMLFQIAPGPLYKKYKLLYPNGKCNKQEKPLMRLLNAVSGNTHFVFVYGGVCSGIENINHKVYMRTL